MRRTTECLVFPGRGAPSVAMVTLKEYTSTPKSMGLVPRPWSLIIDFRFYFRSHGICSIRSHSRSLRATRVTMVSPFEIRRQDILFAHFLFAVSVITRVLYDYLPRYLGRFRRYLAYMQAGLDGHSEDDNLEGGYLLDESPASTEMRWMICSKHEKRPITGG
jgi:hypothetical protein